MKMIVEFCTRWNNRISETFKIISPKLLNFTQILKQHEWLTYKNKRLTTAKHLLLRKTQDFVGIRCKNKIL